MMYIVAARIIENKTSFMFGLWFMVFNVTFNNISVVMWLSFLLLEETRSTPRKPPTRRKSLTLLVLLYFFFWPLCCLFFFDIRVLITHLVSPHSSYGVYPATRGILTHNFSGDRY